MPEGEEKPQPILISPALIREPKKPTIFTGDPGQDPTKWMKEYLRVSKFNQWDDTLCLANVYFFLDGTARTWFDNNEDKLTSWAEFQEELTKTFGDTQLYIRRAKDRLKGRAQNTGEATQSYIQDVLGLCNQIDPNMSDEEKVSHLMKGVAEDVYQALLPKEVKTTVDFIKCCQYIEEMQQKRIRRQKFSRLPNVIPIASVDEEQPLTSLIRKIVREEIQRMTAPQVESQYSELQSIESIVREEIEQSLALISRENLGRVAQAPKRRMQPIYSRPAQTSWPQQNQMPRKTDVWRTTDNRPVCFHCGRLGHVVRYCRDRSSFVDQFKNDRRDATSYRTYNRTADINRETGRNPSPSPSRGRSPTRRYRSPSPYRRYSQSPNRRNEEN
ncbi:uncharacterized protein LOC129984945 [Argiope bruennichi]|uniref:uncharacterized protein LOC129984945 n=1 Tax=Argiope bruennichi TaxID=94029 RepID=UPI0024950461|nr:uncharacterized protein LOC129984945 [Argiope bruennichi]